MPCAAASFLKVASHGSNGAVLRQFAWPNADVGAAVNTKASTAHVDRVLCMVTVRIGIATFAGARFAVFGVEWQLAYLDRGLASKVDGPLSVGAWSKDEQFSTTS